jgi:hypothetical protein
MCCASVKRWDGVWVCERFTREENKFYLQIVDESQKRLLRSGLSSTLLQDSDWCAYVGVCVLSA